MHVSSEMVMEKAQEVNADNATNSTAINPAVFTLAQGDTGWQPGTTKHVVHGPCLVKYWVFPDGGVDHETEPVGPSQVAFPVSAPVLDVLKAAVRDEGDVYDRELVGEITLTADGTLVLSVRALEDLAEWLLQLVGRQPEGHLRSVLVAHRERALAKARQLSILVGAADKRAAS